MIRVALTYDDGPATWTPHIMDVLQAARSRATFFLLGSEIKGREGWLEDLAHHGHELGVHGWTHQRVSELTAPQIRASLRQTVGAIHDATGVYPTLWRPPWHEATADAIEAAADVGLALCGVDVDCLDAIASENDIVSRALAGLVNGAVIGLHDGIAPNGNREAKSRMATVRATARILEHCRSVTVSELRR